MQRLGLQPQLGIWGRDGPGFSGFSGLLCEDSNETLQILSRDPKRQTDDWIWRWN